ncbi:coiled-coil domain-containing protein 192 isoform X2 [Pongo pygmaeus]|nr:coiled-coil domain-containing protein 192 isoform X2 [Pongo pygmaeus]PNJ80261.1 CCDC192 isoform 1 [Pongo abelii]
MTSGSLESDTQQENKVSKVSLDTGQMAFTLAQLESLEICLKEAEEKAKALSEQLSVSEGTKSKLLEQVSRLEEKLEAVAHKEASGEPYEKMVLVKDQCIQKLQAEVKASQEQLIAQKLKHEKKVKKLQTDLATAKQEAAITVLELNEKIKTLYEGKPAPREDSSLEGFCGGLPPVEEGDRKISLIMELSTQVSLQTERITQLKEVLEEKERKIQQLEAERSPHPPQEVKDPPGCLPEAPVFSAHDVPPVVSDENL